jgi:hypothetical protein
MGLKSYFWKHFLNDERKNWHDFNNRMISGVAGLI